MRHASGERAYAAARAERRAGTMRRDRWCLAAILPLTGLVVSAGLGASEKAAAAAETRRVLTAAVGLSLSYHVAKPEEVEPAVRDLAPYFDLLWVDIPTWTKDALTCTYEIERTRQIIDAAHGCGLKVAFCLNWGGLLPKEPKGAEENLFGCTLNTSTGMPEIAEAWDYGSTEALAEFRARCRRLFEAIGRPVEMIVVDEHIIGQPGRDFWFKPISTYWTSPTYSVASLASFREFLKKKGFANGQTARFPVTTQVVEPGAKANEGLPAVPITEQNGKLLVMDDDWPNSELWEAWYSWRTEIYARWLDASFEEAVRYWGNGDNWLGSCYVMPKAWAVKGLGQDLLLIVQQPHVDYICAGYMSGTQFEWFRYAAAAANKKWGFVVQTSTYGKREGTAPEIIRQAVKEGVDAGASIIHVYAGDNFRTDRKEPRDNGLYFMPAQVEAWAESLKWLRSRAEE
jgi:hypothetical protein